MVPDVITIEAVETAMQDYAAGALGKNGKDSEAAVKELLPLLEGNDLCVQKMAFWALHEMAKIAGPKALEKMTRQLALLAKKFAQKIEAEENGEVKFALFYGLHVMAKIVPHVQRSMSDLDFRVAVRKDIGFGVLGEAVRDLKSGDRSAVRNGENSLTTIAWFFSPEVRARMARELAKMEAAGKFTEHKCPERTSAKDTAAGLARDLQLFFEALGTTVPDLQTHELKTGILQRSRPGKTGAPVQLAEGPGKGRGKVPTAP